MLAVELMVVAWMRTAPPAPPEPGRGALSIVS